MMSSSPIVGARPASTRSASLSENRYNEAWETKGTDKPISRPVHGVFRWCVCQPDQFLVKTGVGVKDISYGKKTFKGLFQKVTVIDMAPRNYQIAIHSVSSELVPFSLPVVFTVGPYDPIINPELFLVYARRMSGLTEAALTQVVAGVVHGQTRVYTAGLTIMQMFSDRDKFKHAVQERIQKDLNQYGLFIYNANISEMRDKDEHNRYFENLKQKALEGATTEARIQVAEARKMGDIGEKERRGETSIQCAVIEASVKSRENERDANIANSTLKLELVKTQCKRQEDIARVEAEYATKARQVELNAQWEMLSAKQQVEHRKATEYSKAMVDADVAVRKAEAAAAVVMKAAEAEAAAMRLKADAKLYADMKDAEATMATRNGQADGLKAIFDSFGDQPELAMFYVALENGLFERMAAHMSTAVTNMNPNINVWSTGEGSEADGMAPVRKMFMGLPPMLDAIQQQTAIRMPSWMPQAPAVAEGSTPAVPGPSMLA